MANEKEIPIKFTADTDKAKAKLSELQTSLKHSLGDIQKLIGSIGKELNWANLSKNTEVATKHLDKAVTSIGKLEGSFSKGTKEVSRFNEQLNATEKSADKLGNIFFDYNFSHIRVQFTTMFDMITKYLVGNIYKVFFTKFTSIIPSIMMILSYIMYFSFILVHNPSRIELLLAFLTNPYFIHT